MLSVIVKILLSGHVLCSKVGLFSRVLESSVLKSTMTSQSEGMLSMHLVHNLAVN